MGMSEDAIDAAADSGRCTVVDDELYLLSCKLRVEAVDTMNKLC